MQARAFRLFLLVVLCASPALAQQAAPPTNPNTDGIKMSAAERAVWEKEEAYWRFVKTNDREAYVGLWDERFVGWPRLEPTPIHKDRSFGSLEGRKLLDYKLEPLSVKEYGESVVITLYRATAHSTNQAETDERTIASRLTHTWMKMPQGWQIIGGMSAEDKSNVLPASQPASEEASVRKLSELQFHQGHELKCLAGAHETGDSKQGASVSLVRFDPGCIIPWHWHTPNENVLVIDGALLQEWRDRKSSVATRGDFIHVPSHQVNQATCVSDAPCTIVLYSDAPWDMHLVDAKGREISPADDVFVDARSGTPTTRSSKVTDTEMQPDMIQQVLATDEARRMAMLHGDVSALDSYLADEAMIFWGDGTVDDKTSTLALLRSCRLRYSQLDYDGTRVRLYGQTAVVTGQARIREQIEGQNFAHTAYVTRIYVRQGDRWRLVGSQTTKIAPGSQLGSISTEEARIRQASEDWGHAALSGDLERTVSFYAEDGESPPGGLLSRPVLTHFSGERGYDVPGTLISN